MTAERHALHRIPSTNVNERELPEQRAKGLAKAPLRPPPLPAGAAPPALPLPSAAAPPAQLPSKPIDEAAGAAWAIDNPLSTGGPD